MKKDKKNPVFNDERRTSVAADALSIGKVCAGLIAMISFCLISFGVGATLGPDLYEELKGPDKCNSTILHAYTKAEKSLGPCKKVNLEKAGYYLGFIPKGSLKNDWLTVSVKPIPFIYTDEVEIDTIKIHYDLYIYDLKEDWTYKQANPLVQLNGVAEVECDSEESKQFADVNLITCNKVAFARIPDMADVNHRLDIIFRQRRALLDKFGSIEVSLEKINEKYLAYTTVIRYIFCVSSLVFVLLFSFKFGDVNDTDYEKTFEQKYLTFLGYALFVFNDPLTLFNLLDPLFISPLIISIEVGVFVAALITFWLVMFDRINKETYSPSTYVLKCWKIGAGSLCGFILALAGIFLAYSYLNDPTFSIEYKWPRAYKGLMMVTKVFFFSIVLILFAYSFTFVSNWKKKIMRHKAFFIFSILAMLMIVVNFAMGFYNYYHTGGAAVTLSIAVVNFYIYTLFWLYKPPTEAQKEIIEKARENEEKNSPSNDPDKKDAIPLGDISQSYIGQLPGIGTLNESNIQVGVDGSQDLSFDDDDDEEDHGKSGKDKLDEQGIEFGVGA